MPHTPLLDLLGIDHPIIQAGMGLYGSGATLAAAVSNAGAIGTIGGAKRSAEGLQDELGALGELTRAPFIVNFTMTWAHLHPECLEVALAAGPRAISLSAGPPGDLVPRIHEQNVLVIAQVHTVEQARIAAGQGTDVIIAKGTEAGGDGSHIGGLALIPQVVDAVTPLPVVAAGGISDGRGLAAVLLLGAVGANVGTRFLATHEASLSDGWKRQLVDAPPDERIRLEPSLTPAVGVDGHAPLTSLPIGHDAVLGTDHLSSGQGTGAIRSLLTAAEVVGLLVRGAEQSLLGAQALLHAGVPA